MTGHRHRAVVAAVGALLLAPLAACTTSPTGARSDCVPAPKATDWLIGELRTGVTVEDQPQAVSAPAFGDMYAVAMHLRQPDGQQVTAVFAMNALDGPAKVYAVNPPAQDNAQLPSAASFGMSDASAGARSAIRCLDS